MNREEKVVGYVACVVASVLIAATLATVGVGIGHWQYWAIFACMVLWGAGAGLGHAASEKSREI